MAFGGALCENLEPAYETLQLLPVGGPLMLQVAGELHQIRAGVGRGKVLQQLQGRHGASKGSFRYVAR